MYIQWLNSCIPMLPFISILNCTCTICCFQPLNLPFIIQWYFQGSKESYHYSQIHLYITVHFIIRYLVSTLSSVMVAEPIWATAANTARVDIPFRILQTRHYFMVIVILQQVTPSLTSESLWRVSNVFTNKGSLALSVVTIMTFMS